MIIGHNHIIQELKRLSDVDRLTHSYLFYGRERVGKKLVAGAFARYLEQGLFEDINSQILGDCMIVEPNESKTIGIDAVREIKNFLWQTSNKSKYRTVIIDESEYLTHEAQNALLKITEEPPKGSLLILIAKDGEALQPTLTSRLMKVYFSGIPTHLIKSWLMKEKKMSEREAENLAAFSFGEPGLAIGLFEDERLKKQFALARDLLRRKITIRELIEPDDFNFLEFLDTFILVIAREVKEKKRMGEFWHQLLRLRHDAQYFNLNPRIQLENLFLSL